MDFFFSSAAAQRAALTNPSAHTGRLPAITNRKLCGETSTSTSPLNHEIFDKVNGSTNGDVRPVGILWYALIKPIYPVETKNYLYNGVFSWYYLYNAAISWYAA